MGVKYTTEAISGYNSGAPSDDATESEANKVKWSTHKDKLGDPLKTQIENIDTKLVDMTDVGPDAKTADYTTVAGDHDKTIEVATASLTVTLLAVASAPAGYKVIIKNNSGGTLSVDATGSETIDGSASVVTLADMETLIVQLNQAQAGYITLQQVTLTGGAGLTSQNTFTKTQTWAKGADIASAATLVLGTDGNYFDITGNTGPITAITVAAGTLFMLQFDSTPTLTHHATNLDLPGEANIVVEAGDSLIGFATAANQVHVINYTRVSAIPLKPAAFRGCLVYKSSNESTSTATYTHLSFDTEDYDTDAIHDTATENNKLVVPSGVTKVKLSGGVIFTSNATGYRTLGISKNDIVGTAAGAVGLPMVQSAPSPTLATEINISSSVISVTSGDYFSLFSLQNSGGNLNVLASSIGFKTWFAMEIVE